MYRSHRRGPLERALGQVCATRDLSRAVLILKDAIPDHNPSACLLRRVLQEKSVQAVAVGV